MTASIWIFAPMSNIRKVVGNNIRFYRKKRNFTQQDIAAYINMDTITVSRIELGKVSARLETLEKIAAALKIETYQLFQPPKK